MASNALSLPVEISTLLAHRLGAVLHARKFLFYFKIGSQSAHTTIDGDTHNVFAEGVHIISETNTASDRTEITSEEEHRWRAIPRSILLDGIHFDLRTSLFHFSTIIIQ